MKMELIAEISTKGGQVYESLDVNLTDGVYYLSFLQPKNNADANVGQSVGVQVGKKPGAVAGIGG